MYKINDVQKCLISKGIFWDGTIYENGEYREASKKDFDFCCDQDCIMTFLNEEKTVKRTVEITLTPYKLKIKSNQTYDKRELYDFSEDWCEYQLKDLEYAKELKSEASDNITKYENKGKEELERLEKEIKRVKEETAGNIEYWQQLKNKANSKIKEYEKKKPADTM